MPTTALVGEGEFERTIEKLGYGAVVEASDSTARLELRLIGMSCAACAARIEKSLNGLNGVEKATVNFASEKAAVDYDPGTIAASDMVKAVEAAGYHGEKVESEGTDREKELRDREIRRLRFLFVTSALLSVPLLLAMFAGVFRVNALITPGVHFLHQFGEFFEFIPGLIARRGNTVQPGCNTMYVLRI